MIIFKEFRFEAAHHLPNVPPGHKCQRPHGHSYLVRIEVRGEVGHHTGWVIDYADISRIWGNVNIQLDHVDLNTINGLSNSTAEYLSMWIWQQMIKHGMIGLHAIEVRETPTAGVRYEGP